MCNLHTLNYFNTTSFSFSHFLGHSRAQIECVCPRVSLNAQNNSGYNIPYFMSKQPASRTFPPSRPCTYFSRGKLGYLVARIAAASTLTAHTNAVEANLLEILLHLHLPLLLSSRSRRRSWVSLAPISISVYFSILCSTFVPIWCHFRGEKKLYFLFHSVRVRF